MKTRILILLFACVSLPTIAQQDYIRLNIGSDFSDAYGLKVEYGKSFFKWLETGLSLSVYNSLPLGSDRMGIQMNPDDIPDMVMGSEKYRYMDGKLNTSLMLNGNVDMIKLFLPKSKHGVKIGAGFGVSNYHRLTNRLNSLSSDKMIAMRHQMTFGFDYSLAVMYEYAITQKIAIGIFGEYTNAPEIELMGISVKRSF